MSRCDLRTLLTILLYAGVAIFLFPYVTGHLSAALVCLVVGVSIAVVCGLLRCYLTEGDCSDRTITRPTP